jgi:hypothetical protein
MGAILLVTIAGVRARAQTINVAAGDNVGLINAISEANKGHAATINLGGGTYALTSQLFLYANVSIVGNESTIDMAFNDRAFFIAGGTISLSDLTILGGYARGGDGAQGGGGGAGLGGAIFVGNGSAMSADYTLATTVTLENVNLFNNSAIGGNGSVSDSDNTYGGGGGMGGDGGIGFYDDFYAHGGGGGGGLGNGAAGGVSGPDNPQAGGNGIFEPAHIEGNLSGGQGGSDASGTAGAAGGLYGGGGGGSRASGGDWGTTGGGGGIGGGAGAQGELASGGNGGWGGGGGGVDWEVKGKGGDGGFGGGGGGGGNGNGGNYNTGGGNGGFGGGGGGYNAVGGFGAGNGGNVNHGDAYGGGGLGSGGAIFVQQGASLTLIGTSFDANSANGGSATGPALAGSGVGSNLFLGSDVTFSLSAGEAMAIGGLGGAGNTSDPNIAGHSTDPNAQGGLTLNSGAGGVLTLTGANYYTGATVINGGSLIVEGTNTSGNFTVNPGASLVFNSTGTTVNGLTTQGGSVTVNGNSTTITNVSMDGGSLAINGTGVSIATPISVGNDYSTLSLASLVTSGGVSIAPFGTLVLNGPGVLDFSAFGGNIQIGNEGVPASGVATLVLGASGQAPDIVGAGYIGGAFASGPGGLVQFQQSDVYTMDARFWGVLNFEQNGTGTTVIAAAAQGGWANTTTLNAGTFAYGIDNALPTDAHVVVNGGTFSLGANDGAVAELVMNGGTLAGSGTLTSAAMTINAGTIAGNLSSSADFFKQTTGLATLSGSVTTTGGAHVEVGQLNIVGGGSLFVNGNFSVGKIAAATLLLSDASIRVGTTGTGTLQFGVEEFSTGTLLIGDGEGSAGADIQAAAITAGFGTGAITFQQNYAYGSGSETTYEFTPSIQGNITVTQNGPGATVLNPLTGGGNTYTGGTFVTYGTLAFGADDALPVAGDVTITGGTLAVGAFSGHIDSLMMGPAATIQFTLNGLGAGDYGQLSVGGDFTAAGTLSLLVGYSPNFGDTFLLFPGGGWDSGSFVVASNLPANFSWDLSSLQSAGTITVVPEPATLAGVVGLACVSLALLRRVRRKVLAA